MLIPIFCACFAFIIGKASMLDSARSAVVGIHVTHGYGQAIPVSFEIFSQVSSVTA